MHAVILSWKEFLLFDARPFATALFKVGYARATFGATPDLFDVPDSRVFDRIESENDWNVHLHRKLIFHDYPGETNKYNLGLRLPSVSTWPLNMDRERHCGLAIAVSLLFITPLCEEPEFLPKSR